MLRSAASTVCRCVALLSVSMAGSFGSPASAQDVLLDFTSQPVQNVACNAIPIGDWDGDGIVDLAVGAPSDNTGGTVAGAVRIHSGKDGTILRRILCHQAYAHFGAPLARLPDINGDGIDDLAITAPYFDYGGSQKGSVFLYAGRTGIPLRRIDAVEGGAYPMGAMGDVDGDGICDLYLAHQYSSGTVYVHSGADGHQITSVSGNVNDAFGWTVSALDDLDGDGVPDMVVGAPFFQNSLKQAVGAIYVISTASGAILRTETGTYDGEFLGIYTATLSDFDGDGVRDYGILTGYAAGTVGSTAFVESGLTGAPLATLSSPSADAYFLSRSDAQQSIVDLGDVNGDGVSDFAIGGVWVDPASVTHGAEFLFSGRTFLELDRIDVNEELIMQAPGLDLNGDGRSDVVVGTYDYNTYYGEVRVYSGDDLWLNGNPPDAPAGSTLDLTTSEGVPGALTAVAIESFDGTPTFLLVDGIGTLDAVGRRTITKTVPSGLSGHVVNFRAYSNDAAGRVIRSATQPIQF